MASSSLFQWILLPHHSKKKGLYLCVIVFWFIYLLRPNLKELIVVGQSSLWYNLIVYNSEFMLEMGIIVSIFLLFVVLESGNQLGGQDL